LDLSGRVLPEVNKATAKTISGKQQLSGSLRGLALQFPILGRVAALAMNPISLIVGGLVGAFQLWQKYIRSIEESLSGLKLPDIKQDEIARINDAASAWGKYAEKIASAASKSGQIRADMAAALEAIKLVTQYNKAIGIDTGSTGERAAADVLEDTANAMMADAARRRARAGRPGGRGEAEVEEALKERAMAAAEKIKKERARLGELAETQADDAFIRTPESDARFEAMRQEILGRLREAEVHVERYELFKTQQANRAVSRRELEEADKQEMAAEELRRQATSRRATGAIGDVERFRGNINTAAGNLDAAAISGNMASVAVNIMEIARNSAAMKRASDEAAAEIRRVANNQGKVP
jgi:hypothetical protein